MKLAIMQPYFLPYLGYWQLMRAADRFVVYDDVNYIKNGWINRNRLLINGAPAYITVPLHLASPYKKICEVELQQSAWRAKLLKMVENTYRRAPFFGEVFPVIARVIEHPGHNLADYVTHQLQVLAGFLGMKTELVATSRGYGNGELAGEARVLDICRREGATLYVNLQGGKALYDAAAFRAAGTELRFIAMRALPYRQRSAGFVPHLSIVDALMELGPAGIQDHLDAFELEEPAGANA